MKRSRQITVGAAFFGPSWFVRALGAGPLYSMVPDNRPLPTRPWQCRRAPISHYPEAQGNRCRVRSCAVQAFRAGGRSVFFSLHSLTDAPQWLGGVLLRGGVVWAVVTAPPLGICEPLLRARNLSLMQINEFCRPISRPGTSLLPGFFRLPAGPLHRGPLSTGSAGSSWGRSKFGQKIRNREVNIRDSKHHHYIFPCLDKSSSWVAIVILINANAVLLLYISCWPFVPPL